MRNTETLTTFGLLSQVEDHGLFIPAGLIVAISEHDGMLNVALTATEGSWRSPDGTWQSNVRDITADLTFVLYDDRKRRRARRALRNWLRKDTPVSVVGWAEPDRSALLVSDTTASAVGAGARSPLYGYAQLREEHHRRRA